MRSSRTLLLLLMVVVLVVVDAKFYDFRQPDSFYRTARRALRKTDWALRRRSRGNGRLFTARDQMVFPRVANDYDQAELQRETRRALGEFDWAGRPKKSYNGDNSVSDDLAMMMRRFSHDFLPVGKQYRPMPIDSSSEEDGKRVASQYWSFLGRGDYKGQIPAMRLG